MITGRVSGFGFQDWDSGCCDLGHDLTEVQGPISCFSGTQSSQNRNEIGAEEPIGVEKVDKGSVCV